MAHPTSHPRSAAVEPAAGTRERILDAAEEAFAERGFAGAAVREIAGRVGLNPASLYNHFENKQALYDAVLERGMRPLYEILDRQTQAAATPNPAVLSELMSHLSSRPNLARLIQHEALAGGEHAMRLTGRWLAPLYARATVALERSPRTGDWDREDLPLLLMTYHHLIFGHFAMAESLGRILEVDLHTPDAVARQTRFLEKLTERLFDLDSKEETP